MNRRISKVGIRDACFPSTFCGWVFCGSAVPPGRKLVRDRTIGLCSLKRVGPPSGAIGFFGVTDENIEHRTFNIQHRTRSEQGAGSTSCRSPVYHLFSLTSMFDVDCSMFNVLRDKSGLRSRRSGFSEMRERLTIAGDDSGLRVGGSSSSTVLVAAIVNRFLLFSQTRIRNTVAPRPDASMAAHRLRL